MPERIYLDHAATTPMRPEVCVAMEPFLSGTAFGNPSSLHAEGQRAKHALDDARDTVAGAMGSDASEITFTSGGTEADNDALLGVMLAQRNRGDHLVVSAIEHEAILNSARFLETLDFRITVLPVDHQGLVSLDDFQAALTDGTVLASVMHANNEVGTLQPIRALAEIAHAQGVLLHTDAVQTFGQLSVNVDDLGVDLLTVSAHKIYGPKGVGALYVRRGVSIEPWLHGGAQERERRAGTENVAGIVGFAAAVRAMLPERDALSLRVAALRDQFLALLAGAVPGVVLNGHPTERLPSNVHISIPGGDAELLLLALDRAGVAASSGSACTSGSIEPSHVLLAMGLPEWRSRGALRFTLGRETTEAQLVRAADILGEIAARQQSGR